MTPTRTFRIIPTIRDLENITAQIRDFRGARGWKPFHNPKDMAIAISLEAGDLLSAMSEKIRKNEARYLAEQAHVSAKKYNEYDGGFPDRT